jgi:hypothetical protein
VAAIELAGEVPGNSSCYRWQAAIYLTGNPGHHGEPGGTRTRDHRIKSAMLYQLSYRPAKVHQEFSPSISSDCVLKARLLPPAFFPAKHLELRTILLIELA